MEQSGLAFPKGNRKKKRKKHKRSILQEKTGECYICRALGIYRIQPVQEHHIFGNVANRKISEAEGLKVYLCLPHHTDGAAAVHNNKNMMHWLKVKGQLAYEEEHSREEFMELIGKNYAEAYREEVKEWEMSEGLTYQP